MPSRRLRLPAVRAAALVVASAGLLASVACSHSSAGPTSPTSPTTGPPLTTTPVSIPSSSSPGSSPVPTESPVPAESNPPGDIPDNTAFVVYRSSAGGFQIRVPEGWGKRSTASSVSFIDKLNEIQMSWQAASAAPTVASARSTDLPQPQRTVRAYRFVQLQAKTLPGGPAVLIRYQENSEPNTVTGKQYRLDVLRFELYKSGREAFITLSSPVGADNVDPWRIVSESFTWA